MKKRKYYIVLKNGDRIEYPSPEAWEDIDTKKIKKKTKLRKSTNGDLHNINI